MRSRSPRHALVDEVYRWLRHELLPGRCRTCPRLADQIPGYQPCTGYATELHHLRKLSAAGALANPANVVETCRAGNRAVEDYPEAAHDAGLAIRPCCPEWEHLGARVWNDRFRGDDIDTVIEATRRDLVAGRPL